MLSIDEIDLQWINNVYTLINKHNSILLDKELLINKNAKDEDTCEPISCMKYVLAYSNLFVIIFTDHS